MKKEELIAFITQNGGHTEIDISKLKLSELKEIKNQIELNKEPQSNHPVSEFDEGWSDFVMSNFSEKELRDSMPTCDGLRRVFKKLIGDITQCSMDVIKAPTTTDQTATVSCHISYVKHGSSKSRSISDAFDVNQDNTPWPYCKSSVGTAATKAEARALRKALGLVKVYSAEEVQEGLNSDEMQNSSPDANRPISDSAKIAINTMCNRLSVKPSKLFKFMGVEKDDVSHLSYAESHSVLAKLNAFTRGEMNGGESVPDGIKSSEIIF